MPPLMLCEAATKPKCRMQSGGATCALSACTAKPLINSLDKPYVAVTPTPSQEATLCAHRDTKIASFTVSVHVIVRLLSIAQAACYFTQVVTLKAIDASHSNNNQQPQTISACAIIGGHLLQSPLGRHLRKAGNSNRPRINHRQALQHHLARARMATMCGLDGLQPVSVHLFSGAVCIPTCCRSTHDPR
jgi:hypothetical protein